MPVASRAERRCGRSWPLLLAVLGWAGLLPAWAPAAQVPAPAPEIREASDVGGLEAHSAALILSGQQGGELAASVLVVPFPGPTPETVRLALVVDLAGEGLLATAEGAGERDRAADEAPGEAGDSGNAEGDGAPEGAFITEVHAYAVGPGNTLSSHFTQAFSLSRDEVAVGAGRAGDGPRAWAGVKFLGSLDVPPGEWSVRVLVRQRQSGRIALRAIPVTAPDFSSDPPEPVLLPPLFPEPSERWTLVRRSGPADRPGTFPLDLDAALPGAGRLVPSTRPVVEPGGRAFYLVGRGLPEPRETGGDGEPGWLARVYRPGTEPRPGEGVEQPGEGGRGDGELEESAVRVRVSRRGRSGPGGSELEVIEVSFDPEGLRPGAGTLAIVSPAGAATRLPAVVIPPGMDLATAYPDLPPGAPLWVDLMSLRDTPAPVPLPTERRAETAEITDEALARFQAAYLGALGHLATGDRSAAVAAVVDVERSGMAHGTAADVLARGQLQVALDVSGGTGERLLPLIQLHEDLYVEHRLRGDTALAAHARRVTLGLIELYLRHGDDDDRGRVAAAALVGVAEQLLAYGNTLETLGILELALEHDPDHPPALLLLAALYELLGDSREAVSLLRRLETVTSAGDPVGAEGRLRLGINLRRLGSLQPAVDHLERCLAADRPRWVRTVAYQELAALHVDEGRPEQAVTLLEQALERLPGQQRLYIQLAAIHESLGRPAQARTVLGSLEARVRRGVGRERDSPRLRYSEWSQEAIDRSRELFEQAAAARMPALAEALETFTARGG